MGCGGGLGGRVTLLEAGRLSPPAQRPLAFRLAFLAAGLAELTHRLAPSLVVLESPFQGLNPRSLIVLAQARGALLATLGGLELELREYTPAEVKSAVTGNGRADKEQVARMIGLLLKTDGRWPPDATDALAVALCGAHRLRMDRLLESSPRPPPAPRRASVGRR